MWREQDQSWSRPLRGYARRQCSNLRDSKRKTFDCGNVKGGIGQRPVHLSCDVFYYVDIRGRLADMGLLQQSRGLPGRLILSRSRVRSTTTAVLTGLELCDYCVVFSGELLDGRFSRVVHVLVFGKSPRRWHPTGIRSFISQDMPKPVSLYYFLFSCRSSALTFAGLISNRRISEISTRKARAPDPLYQ